MAGSGQGYRDLAVWQKAMDMVTGVYRAVASFPKSEQYGLSSQIRRSAISVPSNIAEGAGRRQTPAFLNHVAIAYGSLAELETQLLISQRLGFLNGEVVDRLLESTSEIGRMLNGLRNSLKQQIN